MKTPAIDADHDPGIWNEEIRLLKELNVFISAYVSLRLFRQLHEMLTWNSPYLESISANGCVKSFEWG